MRSWLLPCNHAAAAPPPIAAAAPMAVCPSAVQSVANMPPQVWVPIRRMLVDQQVETGLRPDRLGRAESAAAAARSMTRAPATTLPRNLSLIRATDSRILRPRRSPPIWATCGSHSAHALVVRNYLE
jgi:hypothetical protein